MGHKRLLLNMIANIISFISSFLVAFFLTPYLITQLGKEAYSFYPLSNNFINYLGIITLALNSMAARYITVELVQNNLQKVRTYYSSVFFSNVIMVLLLIIPVSCIVIFLDKLLVIPLHLINDIKILFILMFASMFVSLITSVFGVATFATNRLDLKSIGEIFQVLSRLVLYIVLFTFFETSIIIIGVVALIQSFTNFFIQLFYTKKLLPEFRLSITSFRRRAVVRLFFSGIWNSVNSLGNILMLTVTLLLINIFFGPEESGEVAIMQVIPLFITSVISVLFSVFLPRLTHIYAKKDQEGLLRESLFSQKIIGILSTTPIALLLIFGEDIFQLWVPSEDSFKLYSMSWYALIPLIVNANMCTAYGLNIVFNKVKIPSIVLVSLGILNVSISSILVNYFDQNVYAILFVSGFLNIVFYLLFLPFYTSKLLQTRLNFFYTHIIKALFFCAIFIGLGLVIKNKFVINDWLDFLLIGGSFGVVGLLINSLLVINTKEVKKVVYLFQSRK